MSLCLPRSPCFSKPPPRAQRRLGSDAGRPASGAGRGGALAQPHRGVFRPPTPAAEPPATTAGLWVQQTHSCSLAQCFTFCSVSDPWNYLSWF